MEGSRCSTSAPIAFARNCASGRGQVIRRDDPRWRKMRGLPTRRSDHSSFQKTMTALLDWLKKLFGIDSMPPPDKTDPCNAPACVAAKAKLKAARDGFNSLCNGLKSLNAIQKGLQFVLATPLWILIALVAIAILVGGILAIILFSLLAVYAISWVLLPVVGMIIATLSADMLKRRAEFFVAVSEVMEKCPAQCQGDLSPPQCELG